MVCQAVPPSLICLPLVLLLGPLLLRPSTPQKTERDKESFLEEPDDRDGNLDY